MKSWIAVVLLLAGVVASSVALVALKHQGRQLFIELERQGGLHDEYQVEWSRLQIELAWLGETGRIEQQAVSRLRMKAPDRIGVLVADDG